MDRVIFFHVPKSAGSTIYHHLSGVLGQNSFLDKVLGRRPFFILHTKHHHKKLDKLIALTSRAHLVSGHMDWNTYTKFSRGTDFTFTFLREPISRLKSSYNYFCSNQGWRWLNLPGSPEDYSFVDYLRSAETHESWQIDNVAVRMFAGSFDDRPSNDVGWMRLVEKATKNLESLGFIGFHDSFEEDFATLCRIIGVPSVAPQPENITLTRREIEKSDDLHCLIDRYTKWDAQLYLLARDIASKRPLRGNSTIINSHPPSMK